MSELYPLFSDKISSINSYFQKENVLWLDTETGGVYSNCDIIQLSCILDQNIDVFYFNGYCKPFQDSIVTPMALKLLQLTSKRLHSYPTPFLLYHSFLEFLLQHFIKQRYFLIGHSIQFDIRMLKQFERKVIYYYPKEYGDLHLAYRLEDLLDLKSPYCTLKLARKLQKLHILHSPTNKLGDLANTLNITYKQLHRSDEDVRILREFTQIVLAKKIEYDKKLIN